MSQGQPRTYGAQVLARCRRVQRALAAAVAAERRMVPTEAVRAHLDRLTARGSVLRMLQPAIEAGQVRAERVERRWFLAPADCDVLPPRFGSDAARIREAVRRATSKSHSRVPVDLVADELQADPALALTSQLRLGQLLPMLRRHGSVVGTSRGTQGRAYYALADGPRHVSLAVMTEIDRFRRAVRRLFKAAHGMPFTTRALTRFARRHPQLRLSHLPPWAWTGMLHHLRNVGEVAAIPLERRRLCWAPRLEWDSLSPDEREERMRELHSSRGAGELQPAEGGALRVPHAPGHISRNADIGLAVAERRRLLARACSSECDAHAMLQRPLSTSELLGPLARGSERNAMRAALHEAARLRPGMVTSAVVRVGRVGNSVFWDVSLSPAGTEYVQFQRALRAARARTLASDLAACMANCQSPSGAGILGPLVLRAQCSLVLQRTQRLLGELRRTMGLAPLVLREAAMGRASIEELAAAEAAVQRMLLIADADCAPGGADGTEPGPQPLHQLVDLAAAAEVFNAVRLVGRVGRRLSAHLPALRTVRRPLGQALKRGRNVEQWLDRIDALGYLGTMAGGSTFSSYCGQGLRALGRIRTEEPFTATLMTPHTAAHAASCVALSMLDTATARAALVAYVLKHMEGASSAPHPLPAVEAAVYGLGPRPYFRLTRALSDPERAVLKRVIDEHPDAQLRRSAERSLRAWEEAWPDRRVLEVL